MESYGSCSRCGMVQWWRHGWRQAYRPGRHTHLPHNDVGSGAQAPWHKPATVVRLLLGRTLHSALTFAPERGLRSPWGAVFCVWSPPPLRPAERGACWYGASPVRASLVRPFVAQCGLAILGPIPLWDPLGPIPLCRIVSVTCTSRFSKFYCLRQVHLAENLPQATHTQNRVKAT